MMKDPVFSLHTPTGVQNILTADRPTHTRQRRLLSHAFSEKALREQEAIIQRYVKRLMEQLALRSGEGPQDVVRWFNFTTYDLIRDLSFGEQFGCLENGEYDPFVQSIKDISKELTMIQMFKYYELLGLRRFFMPKAIAGTRAQNMQRVIQTVDRRVKSKTNRKDFLHYILAAMETDKGMSRAEMDVNTFSLSIAGSESSATLLCGFVFYTLTHPTVYQKLVTEVREAFQSEDQIVMANVHHLTYLNAVLQECLRVYPPVAVTLPRVVPEGGEVIDGGYVPAGTTVGVNHFACYHDQRNFYRPNEFLPERWMPGAEDETSLFSHDQRNCLQPFSLGPRNCLGKNLAWAEIRLITVHLIYLFDMELDRSVGDRWTERQKVFGFWDKPPLLVHLMPKHKTTM
ncbi:cytochrome P450, putative [Talaromyces stipitatus ATCC 10500]|uniref:Cytochrome P450, putative n=1 Tax=Talaromyces stipitatus (strain ATCC 10500 / CBS 375.48 / QM 6759 / NRRL 1006) TaxID=441959 RepID=B8LZ49_TALSN|nr:cytochrome P450, putative [Talaromyces stipitatus ATCC 10500]EED21093.1 cytochrome P450, putative [Talaromyces stipitatus ATCC 10500]